MINDNVNVTCSHFSAEYFVEFKADCEIVWIKVELLGIGPLFIAAYYRPNEGDFFSDEEFRRFLELVSQEK